MYTWQVLALGLRVLTASYVAAKYVLQLMQRDDKMHLIIQMIHVFLDECESLTHFEYCRAF